MINKLFLILTMSLIMSCTKDEIDNINKDTPPKDNDTIVVDYTGKYSGIITVIIDKKAASSSAPSFVKPIYENYTELMEVNITLKDGKYYLDNNLMSGGPNTFSLSNNKGIFLFNLAERKIDYSYTNKRNELIYIPGTSSSWQYEVFETRSGTLK